MKREKEHNDEMLEIAQQRTAEIKVECDSQIKAYSEKAKNERIQLQQVIRGLQNQLENVNQFQEKEEEMNQEIEMLRQSIAHEKSERRRELADKDREKVEQTDQLKKDMAVKIGETENSLKALKQEQLQTTTKLTVLQNHQLTTELEFQSKQTEKLLFKNNKLQEQSVTLKRDIEIHKQVEQELARRSHNYQRKIKELTNRVGQLEEQNQQFQAQQSSLPPPPPSQHNIIQYLEQTLDNHDKKMAKLQNDYDILKAENELLQAHAQNNKILSDETRLWPHDKKEKEDEESLTVGQLMALCIEGINQCKEQFCNLMQDDQQLQEIATKNINQMSSPDKQILLNMFIDVIEPILNKKNKHTLPNLKTNSTNLNSDIHLPKLIGQKSQMQLNGSKPKIRGIPQELNEKVFANHHNYSLRKL